MVQKKVVKPTTVSITTVNKWKKKVVDLTQEFEAHKSNVNAAFQAIASHVGHIHNPNDIYSLVEAVKDKVKPPQDDVA